MPHHRSLIFHLLPNAHLDPVWLWDWQEGLNEGVNTVRTVLDLMDEFPELTFIRGESMVYEHIQKTEPATFKRILKRIEDGRWDVVGGTAIQPDTNLASTEVLCRQFERGLGYFEKQFGVRPTAAWQADSFGHTAGFPNILAAFGMESFSFTRPMQNDFPLALPAFWWEGDSRNRILCYRQHWNAYCSERENLVQVMDETLRDAGKIDLINVAVFFGLGNHGGGPTRRHIHEIEEWRRQHPEVEVRFSTLHQFFADLKKETDARRKTPIPTLHGEFGYCCRGCYSSVQKFKSLYRNGESQIADSEITRSIIGAATGSALPDLTESWDALLFNAFHDILPGSSIERAFDEQAAWMGHGMHRARQVKLAALNRLVAEIDTTVPPARRADAALDVPVVLWNPQPRPFVGMAEAEVPLDWRPIWAFRDRPAEMPVVVFDHNNRPVPFQVVATEHNCMSDVPWRTRVALPVKIPALGWTTLRVGWRDEPEAVPPAPACRVTRTGKTYRMESSEWTLTAAAGTISIHRNGRNFFSGNRNVEVRVVEDTGGSWGGANKTMQTAPVLEKWRIEKCEILEKGPLRAKLWTRWQGRNSWLDLTFMVVAGSAELKVEGRMLWNDRRARVKLILPCRGKVEYDMPGGRIVRDEKGQVPAARWVVRSQGARTVSIATDVLSDYDATPDELRLTLARTTHYAARYNEDIWRPAVDCGELKFQLCLFDQNAAPDQVADSFLFGPTAIVAPATPGSLSRSGSFGSLTPASTRLLTIEQIAPDTLRVRVQNRARGSVSPILTLGESRIPLGKLGPEQIHTVTLRKQGKRAGWAIVHA